ncbi:hypothetical protein SCA03_29610 [Streptomyces cacaoi]|uniref:Uncharacterized protein n=1 Tax=Streptomyces cacaoi TaxID=1898 RepID=A0A4Y3R317_STRCI|nr:hypothetical protein SCA03_29610 [Streptomyces cacaoi]
MQPTDAVAGLAGVLLVGCLVGAAAHQRVARQGGTEQSAATACLVVTSVVGVPGVVLSHVDWRPASAYVLAAWYLGMRNINV